VSGVESKEVVWCAKKNAEESGECGKSAILGTQSSKRNSAGKKHGTLSGSILKKIIKVY